MIVEANMSLGAVQARALTAEGPVWLKAGSGVGDGVGLIVAVSSARLPPSSPGNQPSIPGYERNWGFGAHKPCP